MMKPICAALLIVALASCGVDGAPKPPTKPGVTVSGQVKVGVGGSL